MILFFVLITLILLFCVFYFKYIINSANINPLIKPIPSDIKIREDIGFLLNNEKFESAIEIGVHKGQFSESIISKCQTCKLFVMVDPWLQQKFYDDSANVDNFKQNIVFQSAMDVVKNYTNRIEFIILKTTSEKALLYLKAQQYDFIYLDGRHDYKSVRKDINLYYPLVKPGGILAGHDYQNENGNEWRMDENGNINKEKKAVKAAVDEFVIKNKLNIALTHEGSYETWMIRKPK